VFPGTPHLSIAYRDQGKDEESPPIPLDVAIKPEPRKEASSDYAQDSLAAIS
jgi:hypothetical protein